MDTDVIWLSPAAILLGVAGCKESSRNGFALCRAEWEGEAAEHLGHKPTFAFEAKPTRTNIKHEIGAACEGEQAATATLIRERCALSDKRTIP